MIDIKLLRDNPKLFRDTAKIKGIKIDIDRLLALDKERSVLMREIEQWRQKKNIQDNRIKQALADQRRTLIAGGKEIKQELARREPELKKIEPEYRDLLSRVPLPADPQTPVGTDDRGNKEVARYGVAPNFKFAPLSHIQLGEKLDILDLKSGVDLSGYRGYVLKNEGVLLHLAVLWFTVMKLREKGFTLIMPPTLIREFALFGSGHFPFDRENVYQVGEQSGSPSKKTEPLYLVGTSEPALLALYAKKTLSEKDLPLKLCGFSPCYRSEIGSYGKDTNGIYRIHEFWKVEQVMISRNDLKESLQLLEELRAISESILRDLELPYRVVQNCTGDMGAGKYKMYDLETWMPSRNNYGETHSDSLLNDWQARRLNIKYRTRDEKISFAHTLNNTGIASPRILIPLLENHQQADGSVKVPKVLQPWVGVPAIIPKTQYGHRD